MNRISVVRGTEVVSGLLFAVSAAWTVAEPTPALLGLQEVLPILGVSHGAAALSVVTAAEAAIGVLLVLRGGPLARTLACLLLGALTVFLVVRGVRNGWSKPCLCLEFLGSQVVVVGILRNLAMIALMIVCHFVNRRIRPGSSIGGMRHSSPG